MATSANPNPEGNSSEPLNPPPNPPPPVYNTAPQGQGRVYTQAEVDALRNEARTEEKNKLYRDLDHYRSRSTDLERQMNELKGQQNSSTNTQVQNESIQREIDQLQQKVQQAEQEKQQLVEQAVEKATTIARKEFEKQRLKDRVEDKKAALISAADGKIIPGLVTGNTLEEIEASAKTARDEYERIATEALAKAGTGVLPKPMQVGGANTPNGQTNGTTTELENLWNMPETEYSKNRDNIKDQVYATLGLRRKQ